MYYSDSPPDSAPAHILQAVLDLSRMKGPDAVASRAVAEAARVAPSYINYRFGSFSALMDEARREADARRRAYWEGALENLSDLDAQPGDLLALAFTANRAAVTQLGGAEDLFWSDALDAARRGASPPHRSGLAAERAFWTRLSQCVASTTAAPDLLLAFSLSLRFSYLVFETPEDFDGWALALLDRFCDRLSGGAPESAADSGFRRAAEISRLSEEPADAPRHETAKKILETTVDLIIEHGVGAVSHRKIAAAGGFSVSSVQHFFGARDDYVRAAFREIYRRILNRAHPEAPPRSMTSDALMARLSQRTNAERPVLLKEFGAMHGLILAAGYEKKAAGAIARALIARFGESSHRLLDSLIDSRGAVGRLDAQIFSMTINQAQTLHLCEGRAPHEDSVDLGQFGRLILEALFV